MRVVPKRVALALFLAALSASAQDSVEAERPLPKFKPPADTRKAAAPPAAARYSPLAAAGGYRAPYRTWYDALFQSLNPENIDWGAVWETRRARFRRHVLVNPYFWTCAFLLLLSALLAFTVYVARADRQSAIIEGDRQIRMLTAESDTARRLAAEAIARHNHHVERCNLVVESLESGRPSPESSDYSRLKLETERLAADRADKVAELARLKAQLDHVNAANLALTGRLDALEQRAASQDTAVKAQPAAGLVERINRLEDDLRRTREENKRLQLALRKSANG